MCFPWTWFIKHAQLIMGTWPIYKNLQLIITKKNFHLIKYLLATFIFFPFFSICTCIYWRRKQSRKYHFDEIFGTGCTESCQNDNFQCSQWRKFRQNDNISFSVSSQSIIRHGIFHLCLNTQLGLARSRCWPLPQHSDIDLVLMDNSGLSNKWVKFVKNISTSWIKTSCCLTHI